MKANYFNKWEFDRALSYLETNPQVSKLKFQEYLRKYPKDYAAYTYYASTLITLGNFDEAEEVLNTLEKAMSTDKKYANQTKKIRLNSIELLGTKLRLLSYKQRYEELYQYYQENLDVVESLDMNSLIFFCKKQLELIDSNQRERHNSYLLKQIIRYEEQEFLEHIKKHLPSIPNTNQDEKSSMFSSHLEIEKTLQEIKKYIPSETRIYPYTYVDVYIFKYNNCGTVGTRQTDYFKVICFHNTSNIITMYPSLNCQDLPHIDLSYLTQNSSKPKVKELSRVDKFNQRWKFN